MNEWDKAARQAAIEVCAEANLPMNDKFVELVRDEFADLRATYEKLVELAKIQNQLCELRPTICDVGNDTGVQSWVNALARQRQLLSDPLVVKAMERMEK